MTNKYLFIAIIALFPETAFSYLDPGTGSILLQGLIAGIAAVAVTARLYWTRLKNFFTKSSDEPDSKTDD